MILHGDCLNEMACLAENSVDACVTDPPYGLEFMGKGWDRGVPGVEYWQAVLRVLKPGGHLLAFGGTRTYARLSVAIEDAGFEIRDTLMWLYGSGFPKSLDISKAIDKAAGYWRGRCGEVVIEEQPAKGTEYERTDKGEPITAEAAQWSGFGTALKPAVEPIVLARKPLSEKTVAANVLKWGTGGLNIDGCWVATGGTGRWPANVIHDGSDEVVGMFLAKTGNGYRANVSQQTGAIFGNAGKPQGECGHNDSGSAARFFYCAKASRADREEGNNHPTVKPTKLMAYLCRLVTPPGGLVLDPFAGSGSTGKAALREGFRFLGIEKEAEYVKIARARLGLPAVSETELPDFLR